MIVNVSTNAELTAALNNAQDGDEIILTASSYSDFSYDGPGVSDTAPAVTIRSANPNAPAEFSGTFLLENASNITIEDVAFDAGRLADSFASSWVFIRDCSDIVLDNVTIEGHLASADEGLDPLDPSATRQDAIEGYPYALGLRLLDVDGFDLKNSDICNARTGIAINGVTDVNIENTTIHNVREGIDFCDVDGLTISNNVFENFTGWIDMGDPDYDSSLHDHADMIQYWDIGGTTGNHNVTISGNHFEMPEGTATQTIFGAMSDAGAYGVTATNFTITDNVIINGHPNAIYLGDVDGGVISGNLVLANSDDLSSSTMPRIRLMGTTENIDVSNNAVMSSWMAETVGLNSTQILEMNVTIEDMVLLSIDPADDNYYQAMSIAELREMLGLESYVPTPREDDQKITGTLYIDTLEGGSGDDTILLRYDNDIATGNDGADTFIFDGRYHSSGEHHTVTDLDFSEGDSLVFRFFDTPSNGISVTTQSDLDSFLERDDVSATETLDGVELTLTDASSVSVTVSLAGIIQNSDAPIPADPDQKIIGGVGVVTDDILEGGSGNDTILLRYGSDTATGNDGADTFIFDGRYHNSGDHHTVTDLDFSEGDSLVFRFFDTPSNGISVTSQSDLDSFLERDDVSATEIFDGVELTLTDASLIELQVTLLF